jgi:hypothetical protein
MSDVLIRIKRAILAGNYAFGNLAGLSTYSKEKLMREAKVETHYLLISSKRAL